MPKRPAEEDIDARTKRHCSTTARKNTVQAIEKHAPRRPNPFFNHLNLDVRNTIYDYIVPHIPPFGNDKGYHRYHGFRLSCRQAKEELEAASNRAYMQYLRTLEADIGARHTVLVDFSSKPDAFKTLKLIVPLNADMDSTFETLQGLYLQELSIHFTRRSLQNTTLRKARAGLHVTTKSYTSFWGTLGFNAKVISITYDRYGSPGSSRLFYDSVHGRRLESLLRRNGFRCRVDWFSFGESGSMASPWNRELEELSNNERDSEEEESSDGDNEEGQSSEGGSEEEQSSDGESEERQASDWDSEETQLFLDREETQSLNSDGEEEQVLDRDSEETQSSNSDSDG